MLFALQFNVEVPSGAETFETFKAFAAPRFAEAFNNQVLNLTLNSIQGEALALAIAKEMISKIEFAQRQREREKAK